MPHVASSNHTDLEFAELDHREGPHQQGSLRIIYYLLQLRVLSTQSALLRQENSR
jgi:hypothetical protein